MNEDPKPEDRDGDEPPAEGSGTTDDGGGERAGLGRSDAEDKISK